MKLFNFSRQFDRWQRVEDEMYLVWIGNQAGAILPRCSDFDFKKSMEYIKQKYTLKQCEQILHLI